MSPTTSHSDSKTSLRGTKQTQPLVPVLRFKEFEDKWDSQLLGNIVSKVGSGSTPSGGIQVYQKTGIPFIRSQNVSGNELILDETHISESINLKMKGSIVKPHDILLNITGGSIGRTCVVPSDFDIGNVNQHVCIIRLKSDYCPRFLQPFLASYKGQKLLYQGMTGSGREGINFQSIRLFKLNLPTLPEQQKIASFLSAVDEKIQQLTKKKELLEQYKKGVMQQLFSGQLRFKDENGNDFPDWGEKRLGEYLIHKSTRNKDLKVELVLSVSNKKGFISQEEQFDGYEVASKDVSNYKIVDRDDIAYNPSRINVGSIARLINFEQGIVSPMYVIFSLKGDLDKIYFENLYNTHRFKHLIKVGCSGSVRDSLNFDDLCDFEFKFPSIKEQQKIATYLSRVDTKIESVNNQITQTQTFKKGLLQLMFV